MSDAKPRTYRIDDETAEKIKEITADIGGNQQLAMAKLVEVFEFQKGKNLLGDKKDIIDKFESHVNILNRLFMGSLEDNQTLSEMIRTEFDALLKSKDSTIQELQEKNLRITEIKENAVNTVKKLDEENLQLKDRLLSLEKELQGRQEDYKSKLEDKDKLNHNLSESYAQLREQKKTMENEVRTVNQIKEERDIYEKKNQDLEHNIADLSQQLKYTKEEMEKDKQQFIQQAELDQKAAVLELKQLYNAEIEELKNKKQAEIDDYQNKYLGLLERMGNMQKEIEKNIITMQGEQLTKD